MLRNIYEILKVKRGSSMVEASVIWPVVITVLIVTTIMVVYFAQLTIVQSQMHIFLIKEEGKISDTRDFNIKNSEFSIEKGFCHGKSSLKTQENISIEKFPKFSKTLESTIHVVDEKKIIRYKDYFDEII